MLTYDLKPEISIKDYQAAWKGYEEIKAILPLNEGKKVLTIECYPGVNLEELETRLLHDLPHALLVCSDDYTYDTETVTNKIQRTLTDDRVFGVMSHYTLDEFFPKAELKKIQQKIARFEGLVIVYGTGAAILAPESNLLVYADLTRWEIQCRFRSGQPNWKADNGTEDALRKFKRGYFFEWRIADRFKQQLFEKVDYVLDTNLPNEPTMVRGADYRKALEQVTEQPFRLVPYFDASVWGGQWMKEKFNLDPEKENYGWAFDGVPEENSIRLRFGEVIVEVPSINVVHQFPVKLLGEKVHARFGKEFPIRFDYLDTVGGGNLSMQVHPHVEYIQDKFGMTFTQNESYYILEANENSTIYLGVKDGVDKDEMIADLKKAENGDYRFPDEKYINCFPVKKHDHYSIPSGTIHCGGPNTVVLEISQTPYIFTFKLWDWGRVGLDGVPRPVHIDHGAENINVDYNTTWVKEQLINPFKTLQETTNYKEEHTGLHELEFIETRRHWFENEALVQSHDSVNMLNLVEGEEITVESIDNRFEPFTVHYGETFIIPEQIKEYRLVNQEKSKKVAVIQAFVKVL